MISLWSRSGFIFYLYATVLTLMPAVPFAVIAGADSAWLFLTGDAFLYLGIAEHSTPDFFSFDGEYPTNGFHPLWQSYLWFIAQIVDNDSVLLMNVAAWTGIACTWIGVLFLGISIARCTGYWILAGLATPGVYFLLVGQGVGGNLSIWDFHNGMENALSFALTGAIALVAVQLQQDEHRASIWLGLGVLTGLLMLCRLDEVFVPAAIGLFWLIWFPKRIFQRIKSVALLGTPPLVFLVCYLWYNYSYMNTFLPVSGAAKGEGSLLQNGWVSLASFFAPIVDIRSMLTDYAPNYIALQGADFRVAQLLVPIILASAFIVRRS